MPDRLNRMTLDRLLGISVLLIFDFSRRFGKAIKAISPDLRRLIRHQAFRYCHFLISAETPDRLIRRFGLALLLIEAVIFEVNGILLIYLFFRIIKS